MSQQTQCVVQFAWVKILQNMLYAFPVSYNNNLKVYITFQKFYEQTLMPFYWKL